MATSKMVPICDGDKRFEWRGNELFIMIDYVDEDATWLSEGLMDRIREESPCHTEDPASVFIIERTPVGDSIFKVYEAITFKGGGVLCYLTPVVRS